MKRKTVFSKKLCDRCGTSGKTMIEIGSAVLCEVCDVEIRPDIETLRNAGRPVNVLQIARRYFKENFAGGTYHFRDVPSDLERKWKGRALKDDCNQRDVLLTALSEYLK